VKAPLEPPFLARGSYRRRRLVDAARVLPFVGAFLFVLPMLWGDEAPVRTAWGGIYIFAAWASLIIASALLSHLLSRGAGDDSHEDG
jgi:amino acid transporter